MKLKIKTSHSFLRIHKSFPMEFKRFMRGAVQPEKHSFYFLRRPMHRKPSKRTSIAWDKDTLKHSCVIPRSTPIILNSRSKWDHMVVVVIIVVIIVVDRTSNIMEIEEDIRIDRNATIGTEVAVIRVVIIILMEDKEDTANTISRDSKGTNQTDIIKDIDMEITLCHRAVEEVRILIGVDIEEKMTRDISITSLQEDMISRLHKDTMLLLSIPIVVVVVLVEMRINKQSNIKACHSIQENHN